MIKCNDTLREKKTAMWLNQAITATLPSLHDESKWCTFFIYAVNRICLAPNMWLWTSVGSSPEARVRSPSKPEFCGFFFFRLLSCNFLDWSFSRRIISSLEYKWCFHQLRAVNISCFQKDRFRYFISIFITNWYSSLFSK